MIVTGASLLNFSLEEPEIRWKLGEKFGREKFVLVIFIIRRDLPGGVHIRSVMMRL